MDEKSALWREIYAFKRVTFLTLCVAIPFKLQCHIVK